MRYSQSALNWLTSLLEERYGVPFLLYEGKEALILSLLGSDKVIIFDTLQAIFHQSKSDFPCYKWVASVEGFYGAIDDTLYAPSEEKLASPLIEFNDKGALIHYDILGLTYWMLTRLEEVARIDLDNHGRFPAVSSHAYRYGYLERPIVDEWLHILMQVIQGVWPDLLLRKHEFRIQVSHDVDFPSAYVFKSWRQMPKILARYLLKEKKFKQAFFTPFLKLRSVGIIEELHSCDPFNTFDWLMDISEENNLKSSFYFICGRTEASKDGDYELEHPLIRKLLRNISNRGHEIGLHPSYGTYQSPELIQQEYKRLRAVCSEEGIIQDKWGGRMHYLRWEHPTTLDAWEEAGLDYDSTLGYADSPGFRCGTCFEYPAYNPVTQKQLQLRIRPLIVMEASVIVNTYLGLGLTDQAQEKFLSLRETCRKVHGIYSLLWHNSSLQTQKEKEMYWRSVSSEWRHY